MNTYRCKLMIVISTAKLISNLALGSKNSNLH